MRPYAHVLIFVLFLLGVSWAAMGDPPEDFTWYSAPGGSVTASTVDFDTWMELMAEFIYDEDTPFDFLDPNGEPDGVSERNGRAEPSIVSCDYNANEIPDATELAVITAVCNDTNHPLHDIVYEAFKANVAQCQIDLGPVAENLAPALKLIMAAYVTLGDGDYERYTYGETVYGYGFTGSWGGYASIMFGLRDYASLWPEGAPDSANYQRLVSRLSACDGDADSDAVLNINEFYAQGQDRLAYVAAAIDQGVSASAPDPYHVCTGPSASARWGINYFYNPTNHYVYHLTSSLPWVVAEDLAEHFTIQGVSVAGHLTTIRSAAENEWLVGNVLNVAGKTCLMGATDEDAEGVWKWVENGVQFWQGDANGSGVGGRYSNWNGGEPNNSGEEDAGEIYVTGVWNDNDLFTDRPGIIEFTNGGAGYPDESPANGLPDWWEPYVGSEGEGEGEGEVDTDTDDDGMPNAWESANGFNPDDPSDAALDADSDGLSNLQEFQHMTRPNDADTDDDGLADGVEITVHYTNPLDSDSDNDTLADGAEVNTYGTNPLAADSDDDTMPDGYEVEYGLDPLVDDSGLDPDGDGLTNAVECQNGCDPHDSDTDDDSLTDSEEVLTYLTDPADADTDADGLSDGDEVHTYSTDPTDEDTDGDYLSDGEEVNTCTTDPLDVDTDDDTFNDRLEVYYGADPLDPNNPDQPNRAFSIGGMELLFHDANRNVYFPVWSSNGRRVAFIARTKVVGETDAFVTNLDGLAKAKRIGATPESIRITNPGELTDWRCLAWSPDGTALLYKGPGGQITRKSSSGDGVYFSPLPTPYGLGIGIHTTSLPENNRMIFSSGGKLYVCAITPSAGIVSGPFLVFRPGASEETRFVRLNADGTKAVFNIRPSYDSTKGDLYIIDLEPILSSSVAVPYGIADGIALGVIHAIEDKADYAQCPSFTNDGELVIWSEDIAQEFVEPVQPSNLPYTNFDVIVGNASGAGVPQQMMFPVDDGQIHTSPGGLRMSYTRDWDLYAVTLVVTQKVEGTYDELENNIVTDAQQVLEDGSGTELNLPASITVDFPPGVDPVITMETPVTPVDDPELPPDIDAVPVVRTFGPAGTTFSEPIPVTITYTDAQIAGMSEAALRVFVYNPATTVFDIEVPESDIVLRDLDNNAITFLVDHFSTFGIATSKDTDGDGTMDKVDGDDDDDGIPDAEDPMPLDTDNDGYDNDVDPDDDSDGIPDADEPDTAFDTNNDGVPNAVDPDDDSDGIPDVQEPDWDARYDTDNDGLRNDQDSDDDNDGLPDLEEDVNGNGVCDPGETDLRNPDTDGDGSLDGLEVRLGTDPLDPASHLPISGAAALALAVLLLTLAAARVSRGRNLKGQVRSR